MQLMLWSPSTPDAATATLKELRGLGVRLSLDDFGSGHSALGDLRRFPFDSLKIDRGFVEDLPDRFEDAAIVKAVVQLAHGLNLRVIAEGVERQEQLDFLRSHGCREVQGYLFGMPMRLADLEKLLERKTVGAGPMSIVS